MLEGGVREEGAKTGTHVPAQQVGVPVPVRATLGARVVDMEAPQTLKSESTLDLGEKLVHHCGVGYVGARNPEVTRVEAETEALWPI